jgi:flagellar biosynthesis/type III secretory pathway M-ring protein FliF/YscJ
MSALHKTPTTRILTLAALTLAAGVFCLRAVDLFSGGVQPANIGSALEQELTHLIEPVAGQGNVRVSVKGGDTRTYLILLNGPQLTAEQPSVLKTNAEAIIKSAAPYNAAKDTLTLSQFPFAQSVSGELTTLEIAEFSGLGLICILLLAGLVQPASRQTEPRTQTTVAPETVPAEAPVRIPARPIAEPNRAAELAANDPDGTVRVLRAWMNDTGGNA